MANELKTRIVLEGEAAYTRAMSQAASEIRTLNAEQRLAEAQFKATGDAQAHAAAQARILRDQIAAQQRAVDAAEKAIADLTAQGVEPNAAAMLKWRTKLANARSMLTTLQTKLNGVESDLKEDTTEFGKAGEAAEGYQESLSKIGGTINTQAAIDAIDKITGAIENTVRMAARATKAVIGMASDAGKWADELKTTSEQMGVDPETLQSWQYASMFIDTEVTDIAKSWQDITKRFGDGNNEFGVGLAQMGIRIQDTGGKFLTADKVFWNIIDHLHGMTDENKRAAKATEIFGQDWKKLMPLINAGSEAYMALAEEGKEVAVVSNDNVDALGEMDDSFNGLQARFMKLKLDTLAALAPTFESVANALSQAVTALDEFIQSEEGRQALESLGSALEGIINQFIGVDENGENNFAKLVGGAKDIVTQLNTALQWLNDHAGDVAGAIGVIAGAYGLLEVSKGVLTFTQLLRGLPLDKIRAMFGGGTPSAAGSGAGANLGRSVAATATKGFLLDALKVGGVSAALIGGVWALNSAVHENDAKNIEARSEAMKESAQEAAAAYGDGASEMLAAAEMAADALGIDKSRKSFDGSTVLSDPAAVTRTLQAFKGYEWLRDILDAGTWDKLQKIGTDESTLGMMEETELLQSIGDSIIDAMNKAAEGAEASGEAIDDGVITGVEAKAAAVAEAAAAMARGAIDAINQALDNNSPSKVMAKIGAFTAEGFAQGIAGSAGSVMRAVDGMAGIARRAPMAATGGAYGSAAAGGSSYSSSFYIDKYIQNTGEDARALAQRVQDVNGWTRSGFGHRT